MFSSTFFSFFFKKFIFFCFRGFCREQTVRYGSLPVALYGKIVLNRHTEKTDIRAGADCHTVNNPLPNKELNEQNGKGQPK